MELNRTSFCLILFIEQTTLEKSDLLPESMSGNFMRQQWMLIMYRKAVQQGMKNFYEPSVEQMKQVDSKLLA
jgi:hypothetical protein